MTYSDREKIERLRKTFDTNYRLTRLYATYLEHCPELIKSEMVDTLCEGGEIEKKDALVALLSTACGLDDAVSEDRRLIRNYLYPSVRILDVKKYTENPYYKNIKIENLKDGNWEFKIESYPPYRAMICDDMIISEDFEEIAPLGFFSETFSFPAVLEDGNEWMTLSPVDLDTCDEAIFAARGRVITFGLGLGYYAYMVSEKEDVESITVIEKSEKVINLFKKYILPQFKNKEKVRVICADAFEYAEKFMGEEKYDFAFVDTWRDASDGAPMYEKMKKLEKFSHGTRFEYWIENFLISRLRALKFEELYDAIEKRAPEAPQSYDEFIKRLTEI